MRRIAPALALSLVTAAACGENPSFTCEVPPVVPAVANVGPGVWERQGVRPQLTELWRVAGQRAGQILGEVVVAAASHDQQLALADFTNGETVVVLSNGSWQGGWTRKGRGPGEVQHPVAVNWTPAGDLVVFDIGAPKVVFLDAPTNPIREVPVPPALTAPVLASGEVTGAAVLPDGGVLIVPPLRSGAHDSAGAEYSVLHWRPVRPRHDTVAAGRVPLTTGGPWRTVVPGRARPVFAAGAAGYAVSDGAAYRIVVRDPSGDAVRVICRDAAALPLRDAALELPAGPGSPPVRFPPPPADSAMPFGRLLLGARGWLWAQRERPAVADGFYGLPGATWDVFDETGAYLGVVSAPPRARIQAVSGPRIFAFELGALDEIEVVAYALTIEPASR